MNNLKTVLITMAIFSIATISSYAQTAVGEEKEKFMFLFRGGDTHPDNAESKEEKEYIQSWITWMQGLGQKEILESGENLLRTGKQVTGRSKVVTDAPFVVKKEMVNGYLIIKAKDIDEAVEISKGCPIFEENGKVEIRPFRS